MRKRKAAEYKLANTFERREIKYLLTPAQRGELLSAAGERLREDRYGWQDICNVYFDTPDDRLIRTSLEKPVYKEKLRLRSYGVAGETDDVFFELKKKYNGIVYKRRAVMAYREALAFASGADILRDGQILRELRYFLDTTKVEPRLYLAYRRIAYTDEEGKLRVTFDTDIVSRRSELGLDAGIYGAPLFEKPRFLMEIKAPGALPLWLCRILSELKLYPTSFSKYGRIFEREQEIRYTGPEEVQTEVKSCLTVS